jgi:hypothetical protein
MKKINRLPESNKIVEVSTFDYKDCLSTLEHIYGRVSRAHNITLSPLGSKMQAIGSTLFCYMHPDVRVVFAVPEKYIAPQYSSGCRAIWMIELGSTRRLRHSLDSVGLIEIVD